jgi:shikimate kinase
LTRLLTRDRIVIATGGGAFADALTRELLLSRAWTCHLHCAFDEALRRASLGDRPLLDTGRDGGQAPRELYAARQPLYALAHARVETEGLSPKNLASRILSMLPSLPLSPAPSRCAT